MNGRRELLFSPYIAVYQVKRVRRRNFPHLSQLRKTGLKFFYVGFLFRYCPYPI
jgi:hypothetical protein